MDKKKPLSFHVKVSERELEIIKFLQEQEGQHTPAGVMRHALVFYYNKQYFDKRSLDPQRRSDAEGMTNEEYCVKNLKGAVDEKNQTCRIKTGGLTRVVPLGLIKES